MVGKTRASMGKRIVPQGTWIVGVCRTKETTSLGGIVLPAVADHQDEVTVMAVGPDVKRAKVGDVLIFEQGRTTRKGGQEVWLIEDEHVIASLVDE
jgi:co-chaperonin GroES (HSP10)